MSHFWTSIWKYDESTIIIEIFNFQMDEALICINVFFKISYYNHNLLKFSYKSMFENLKK
jgi:hypothetical protein